MIQPFKSHKGLVATLDRANVDTDQIIAKQFLKSIKRTGFGESLFYDWRYRTDPAGGGAGGKLNPDTGVDVSGVSVTFCCNNCKGCQQNFPSACYAG